jgi:phosphatidylglycerol:prolipoprotein diacylglycerol transferase
MYPFLFPDLLGYTVELYDIMIGIGVVAMLFYVTNRFEKRDGFSRETTNKLLLLILLSLGFALFSSWVFDGIFHTIESGEVEFGSITFIGGLIGGVIAFLVLLNVFYKSEKPHLKTIFNTIITGVVLAHAFGRIGCFFAGCCFGIPTDSIFGVVFPYGHAKDLYPSQAIYPTQLFESAFLFILFFTLDKYPRFKGIQTPVYLISYGVWRFLIEFIRGDDRGVLFVLFETKYNVFPTPSQFFSLLMFILGLYLLLTKTFKVKTSA